MKASVGFKKSFLFWGIGILIAVYAIMRIFFGVSDGINFLGNKAVSSLEEDILKHTLYGKEIYEYGNAQFICTWEAKEFYHKNHYFFVSNYPKHGPAIVVIETENYESAGEHIYRFGAFPFKEYGSLEGMDYIDKEILEGYGFVKYKKSHAKIIQNIENTLNEIEIKISKDKGLSI